MARMRNICFTINNPTEDDRKGVESLPFTYLIVGNEVGQSNTRHLQGYCELSKQLRMKSIKKAMPRAHIEKRKGSAKQAADYCKKDGDYKEHGVMKKAGRRNDLRAFVKEAKENKGMQLREVIESHPLIAARYPRFVETVNGLYRECKARDVLDNHWYVGASGTGKSSTARKKYPVCFIKSMNKWWDAYDGEESVLIDDFGMQHSMLAYYLKIWADHYPFKAEVKGGTMLIRPLTIVVTSQYKLEEIFSGADLEALQRRFKVTNFRKL